MVLYQYKSRFNVCDIYLVCDILNVVDILDYPHVVTEDEK